MKQRLLFWCTAGSSMLLALGAGMPAMAAEVPDQPIKIVYTNDVHCGIEDGIGYAGLAQYMKEVEVTTPNVTLVDAGDAVQGTPVGTLSEGEYIVDIMNQLGYDVAVPGNHEFDYGMDQFMNLADKLDCGYLSCNFTDLTTGKTVFDGYRIIDYGSVQVAFVGVCTPETFTKSTPAYFQDADGNYIYGFREDDIGLSLYQAVQASVDEARSSGADYVILVGHLGENGVTDIWSGENVIAHTSGIDALIDGHSHETIPCMTVKNAAGEDVILTQTGTKLENIGMLTINTDGTITAALTPEVPATDPTIYTAKRNDTAGKIAEKFYGDADCWSYLVSANESLGITGSDTKIKRGTSVSVPSCIVTEDGIARDIAMDSFIQNIKSEYESILSEKIGTTDFALSAKDDAGNWLVRTGETGLSDLCADALRAAGGTDIAIVNGGGIRTNIEAGDITMNDALSVFPFNNMLCSAEVTGQQILDCLEMGASQYPEMSGGFIHPSGMTYTIDSSVPSGVVKDDKGNFVRVDGKYRVTDVKINGEPLDVQKTYTVTGFNYYLKNYGDGMTMFEGCTITWDDFIADADALADYIAGMGTVSADYAAPQGRITIR